MSRLGNNNIALISDSGKKITYNELFELEKEYVKNMSKRSMVIMLCSNSVESIIFYAGCLNNKIVPLLLNDGIDDYKLNKIIESYKPQYIFLPSTRKIINQDVTLKAEFEKCILYEIHQEICVKMNPELALLLPTSGSTGNCKFVRLSYKNIKSNTCNIIEYLKINTKSTAITMLPMSYTYGLSVINTHLYSRATIVVTSKKVFDKQFWLMVRKYKVESLVGVPYTYDILKKMALDYIENSYIKVMTQAGGKLSNDMQIFFAQFAKKNNIKFYIMYGQTEATARMAYLSPECVDKKIGSVGKAISGGSFSTTDENEIIYYGDNVCMGYSMDYADLYKSDEFGGVLNTGDLGYIDEEGFLYITGRKDNVKKIMGIRIDFNDIEEYLYKEYGEKFLCYVKENKIVVQGEQFLFRNDICEKIGTYIGVSQRNIIYKKEQFIRSDNGKVIRKHE